MIKKKICYTDYLYYDAERDAFYGDMGYAFNDEAESRTPIEEIDELRRSTEEYINSADSADESDGDGGYSVFIIRTAILELEEEDDALWSGNILEDTGISDVFVCASEEYAGERVRKEFAATKGVKFHFRDGFNIFA